MWDSAERHLTVTLAPAASRASLALSAASLLAFSRTGFGAASTRSLASLRPRPVIVRTSLMTWIFLSPAASRMTSNSSWSAAASPPAAAPPAAAGAAAAATGAAAVTSKVLFEFLHELRELDEGHFLECIQQVAGAELRHVGVLSLETPRGSRCESGFQPSVASASADASTAASAGASASVPQPPRGPLRQVLPRPRGLRQRGQQARGLQPGSTDRGSLRLQGAENRAACDSGALNSDAAFDRLAFMPPASLARRTSRDSRSASLLISAAVMRLPVEEATLDDEGLVFLREVAQTLGRQHRITGDEGDRRGAGEQNSYRGQLPRPWRTSWSACSWRRHS